MKTLVSIIFLPHMVELVQVKVFFCFPASEVPTAGSPSVRREFRRRSDRAVSFFNRPGPFFYCGYFFLLSSCRAVAALSAPRATPSCPAATAGLPRRGPCRLPRLPPSPLFFHPSFHFSLRIVVHSRLVWRRILWWWRLCPWICSSTTTIRFFSSLLFSF